MTRDVEEHEPTSRPTAELYQAGGATRWPAMLAAAFLLGLLALLWFRFNAPPGHVGKVFPFDFIFYYYPMLEQAAERMRDGQLPLWNPWQCCGVPFMATAQVAVCYPGTWLALVLPVGTAIVTSIVLHCALAGWFATMFFRSLGSGWWASAIGGGLFVFACVLGQSFWPSELCTITWMPFLFWSAERFCGTGARRWWLAISAGTALQALAGFPQFVVYTWYLLVPFILVRLWHWRVEQTLSWRQAAKRLATIAIAVLLAIGLSAAQLLPTLELTRYTKRNHSLSDKDVHYLEIERGVSLQWHGLIRNMFSSKPKLITFDFPDGTGHLGVMTPFMVALGLIAAWHRGHIRLFAIVAAVCLILALGYSDSSRWLYELYARLPTGNMFRTPSRLLLLCWFCTIAIAVSGFDAVARGLPELRVSHYAALLALLVAGCLVLLNAKYDRVFGPALALVGIVLTVLAVVANRWQWSRGALLTIIAAYVAGTLAYATDASGSLRDLPLAYTAAYHYRGETVVPTEKVSAMAQAAGLQRIALPGLWLPKVVRPAQHHYAITDYEPLLPQRWASINLSMDGTPVEIASLADPAKHPAFYDIAGVGHLFSTDMPSDTRKELDSRQWRFFDPNPPPPTKIRWDAQRRTTALPRAYLVEHFAMVAPEEVMRRVVVNSFDWHGSVLLEADPGMTSAASPAPAVAADIMSYEPERVVVRCNAARESLLVLSDTWFPGWRASLAGKKMPILRANYLFRAVRVPAGTSEVIFEYRPAAAHYGMILSILSLLTFAFLAVWPWLNHRAARPSPLLPVPTSR